MLAGRATLLRNVPDTRPASGVGPPALAFLFIEARDKRNVQGNPQSRLASFREPPFEKLVHFSLSSRSLESTR